MSFWDALSQLGGALPAGVLSDFAQVFASVSYVWVCTVLRALRVHGCFALAVREFRPTLVRNARLSGVWNWNLILVARSNLKTKLYV